MDEMDRVETTFWMDFSIADAFGKNAIIDTFNRAFNQWKDQYKYITELSMTLNHKCWDWYNKNEGYSELYSELYYKVQDYVYKNLKDKELNYYYKITN